jgi:hypothetical protein
MNGWIKGGMGGSINEGRKEWVKEGRNGLLNLCPKR